MHSCLYETEIMHHRFVPREHRFSYKFFSFYLDLDEIDDVVKNNALLSRNRFNVYSFYDSDHLQQGVQNIKSNVTQYIKNKKGSQKLGRIMLLTYLRTFGYVFNPVSFYFCFDEDDNPMCVVPEIGNTFGEIKPFMLGNDSLKNKTFREIQDKFFYISPFTRLNDQLDFRLKVPGEKLNICVNTVKDEQTILVATMTGKKIPLTQSRLLGFSLKYPFVTLKVITLIHWHALLLWMKRVPFQEKDANRHLQKEYFRGRDTDARNNTTHNRQKV